MELRHPAIGGSESSAANRLAAEADFHIVVQRRMSSRYRIATEILPHFSDWRIRLYRKEGRDCDQKNEQYGLPRSSLLQV